MEVVSSPASAYPVWEQVSFWGQVFSPNADIEDSPVTGFWVVAEQPRVPRSVPLPAPLSMVQARLGPLSDGGLSPGSLALPLCWSLSHWLQLQDVAGTLVFSLGLRVMWGWRQVPSPPRGENQPGMEEGRQRPYRDHTYARTSCGDWLLGLRKEQAGLGRDCVPQGETSGCRSDSGSFEVQGDTPGITYHPEYREIGLAVSGES